MRHGPEFRCRCGLWNFVLSLLLLLLLFLLPEMYLVSGEEVVYRLEVELPRIDDAPSIIHHPPVDETRALIETLNPQPARSDPRSQSTANRLHHIN